MVAGIYGAFDILVSRFRGSCDFDRGTGEKAYVNFEEPAEVTAQLSSMSQFNLCLEPGIRRVQGLPTLDSV